MLGVNYLADSIAAASRRLEIEEAYRVYHTDCMYALCAFLGVEVKRRFLNILHPELEDRRTGTEIANERLERFGIKVVD